MQESGNAQLLALFNQRDELKKQLDTWQHTAEKIAKRLPNWSSLKQLLQLCKGLAFHAELQTQYDAIISNRSLLDDPDPVVAQVTVITDKLRTAITHLNNQFSQEYQQLKEQLEGNHNWQKLNLGTATTHSG